MRYDPEYVRRNEATLDGSTTTVALVPCPSIVAVIMELPGATAVTRPNALIVALAGTLEVQATARPFSSLPAESSAVGVIRLVSPTTSVSEAGTSLTEATRTGTTVTLAAPLTPSLVAVTTTDPAPVADTAVTTPAGETVAFDGSALVHTRVRPDNCSPFRSNVVAFSVDVAPTVMDVSDGVTTTDATPND